MPAKHHTRQELFRSVEGAYRKACSLLEQNYDAILQKLKDDSGGGTDPLFLSEWRKLVIRYASGMGDEYVNAFFSEIDPNRSITTAMGRQACDELERCGHLFLSRQKAVYKDLLFAAGFSGSDDLRMWMDDLSREVTGETARKREELNRRILEHNKRPDLRKQSQLLWYCWSLGIVGVLLLIGILWAVVFT